MSASSGGRLAERPTPPPQVALRDPATGTGRTCCPWRLFTVFKRLAPAPVLGSGAQGGCIGLGKVGSPQSARESGCF